MARAAIVARDDRQDLQSARARHRGDCCEARGNGTCCQTACDPPDSESFAMQTLRLLPDVASPPRPLTGSDALRLLAADRREILRLGHHYLGSHDDEGNGRRCDRVCAMLTVGMLIEESLLHPFVRRELRDSQWLADAEIANYVIKGLIAQLHSDNLRLLHRDALFKVLIHYIDEHFNDAEAALFEPLAALSVEHPELTRELGVQIGREKQRLDPWFGLAEESPPEDADA